MQVDIPTTHEGAVDIKGQVAQLKEKIKSVEAQKGPISYSVGKDDREVIILGQPLQQQAEVDWGGGKTRQVNRSRYIVVGSFGIGAIDFVKQAKFDSSDDIPAVDEPGRHIEGVKYAPEGQWINMPGSNPTEDDGRNETALLRSLRNLEGVDKRTNSKDPLLQSVPVAVHDTDGFGITPDGTPHFRVGFDFSTPITQEIAPDEFGQALKLSVESVKPIELKTEPLKQANLLSAALQSF